jgi:metal-responsive CopG/Arc/MetJ family transcriptional regulator
MKTKAHLVLPREILEEVDQIAGKRKRSLFIAEATREKLQKERFLRTLEETQGAWGDKNHPDLKTERDVEQFVSEKRQSYRKRLKRITHE